MLLERSPCRWRTSPLLLEGSLVAGGDPFGGGEAPAWLEGPLAGVGALMLLEGSLLSCTCPVPPRLLLKEALLSSIGP